MQEPSAQGLLMSNEALLMDYLREAASWDGDRVAQAQRSARRAWVLSGIAALIAALAVCALALLTPLKRVEPFLIRVDNSTGIVDVVPTFDGHQTMPEAVTRFLLAHYVVTCERYLPATAEQDYTECGAFNGTRRNQEWSSLWSASNPQSPLVKYRDGTTVKVQIQSISFFARASGLSDLAQVRFTRSSVAGNAEQGSLTRWIANIQFAYGDPPANPDTRRWNPLGFRVVEYHTEPEAGEAAAPPASAVAK
jgi:type IV secretion system protein VirB8